MVIFLLQILYQGSARSWMGHCGSGCTILWKQLICSSKEMIGLGTALAIHQSTVPY
jgi:hypothetical protein